MEVFEFFKPVDVERLHSNTEYESGAWFHTLELNTGQSPSMEGKTIALIGLDEPEEPISSAYEIRKYLYKLKKASYAEDIIDMGDFSFDYSIKSYQELGFVMSELISKGVIPIVMNGRQDVTYAQYLSFAYIKRYANLVNVDSRIDFTLNEMKEIDETNYIQQILLEEPSYLFSFSNVGHQTHFTDPYILNFLEELYFDFYRLGECRANMQSLEPVFRTAHFASFDTGAIRHSDASASSNPSPNGFFGEEICQLAKYAGMSTNMQSIGFYEYIPEHDPLGQTAHLIAQMIWYFVEGYEQRYLENPYENKSDFTKYITNIQNNAYHIVFYKSIRTGRWWMEVPITDLQSSVITQQHMLPCSYEDYELATRNEIPERWWQALKKYG